jgi:hypothetical protein
VGLFRTRRNPASRPESPALLLRDLHPRGEVKFLWAHQEKLLDEYHTRHTVEPDVALELPTGSGKTLVGLLIAEYRRRANDERVVYLCPTRQLCYQVQRHADQYGIPAVTLVGSQIDYSPQDFTAHQRGAAVAITTYSSIFNVNPRIDDPEVVICDDAHASETHIASLWNVDISSVDHSEAFTALVNLLWDAIPEHMRVSLHSDGAAWWDRSAIDLVPVPAYAAQIDDLVALLDHQCQSSDLQYPWSKIREHIDACNIFISPSRIEIRPLIPPTMSHMPFANAHQRVFMSATLGEGGELERITGIRKIVRLAAPPGTDTHGTGRRLILFPDLFAEDAVEPAVDALVRSANRTLVLAKDGRDVEAFRKRYRGNVDCLGAKDIEENLEAFTLSSEPTALVLANRYEGIDLPGEACRQLILARLPIGADLQERFFLQRLGAQTQLRNRIRTRLTQGTGRCTRDESDYALVLLIGHDLLKWCGSNANVGGLHPELQAEIEFGMTNSDYRTVDEVRSIVEAFLNQDHDWQKADEEIATIRSDCTKAPDDLATTLQAAVAHEVEFVYAMWRKDFDRAYEYATAAAEALSGGSDLRPYRVYWHYEACVAAHHAWLRTGEARWIDNIAHHAHSVASSPVGSYLLVGLPTAYKQDVASIPAADAVGAEEISALLEEWSIKGRRFEKRLGEAQKQILSSEAKPFESGLATLGRMLGARVRRWPDDQGAPDGLWLFASGVAVVFEAKSDEDPDDGISLSTVRQAQSHEAWIRSKGEIPEGTPVITVITTPRTTIHEDARVVAGNAYLVSVGAFRDLFGHASRILRSVRMHALGVSEETLRDMIDETYRAEGLTHQELERTFRQQELSALPGKR